MFFSSGFFGSLLTGSGKWNASLAAKAFEFFPAGGKKKAIPYESISFSVLDLSALECSRYVSNSYSTSMLFLSGMGGILNRPGFSGQLMPSGIRSL